MKKLIGLFHHREQNEKDYYSFYPVKVLTDEYGDPHANIYDIEWGPYIDQDVYDVCPNYHNLSIHCYRSRNNGEDMYEYAASLFNPQTWGVLDTRGGTFANVNSERGKSNSIPFMDICDTPLSLTENGCAIVIGRNLVEASFRQAAISFGFDEQFYIKESSNQFSGPYVKITDDTFKPCENCATWTAKEDTSFLYCDVFWDDESESFDLEVILTDSLVKVSRGIAESKTSVPVEKKNESVDELVTEEEIIEEVEEAEEVNEDNGETEILEETEAPDNETLFHAFVANGALFPKDYPEYKVTILDNEKRSAREFKAKEFKGDLETPKSNTPNKIHIMSEIYLLNAATVGMLNPILKLKDGVSSEIYFTQIWNNGYISKVTIDGLGEYYRANRRGLQAFESPYDIGFMKLPNKRNNEEEKKIDESSPLSGFVARLAYTRVLESIYSHSQNDHSAFAINNDIYTGYCVSKDGKENATIGVFANDIDLNEVDANSLKDLTARKDTLRLFVSGVNKEHALVTARTIRDYYGEELLCHIFAYALTEDKYYELDGSEVSAEHIWSEDIEKDVLAKISKVKSVEVKAKEKELAAKKAEQEEKKKKIAEAKAQAELDAKVEKEATTLKSLAEKAISETLERKKTVEDELHSVEQRYNILQQNVSASETRVESLKKQAAEIVKNARKALESPEFARVTMDGELAYRMREAAAEWKDSKDHEQYEKYCEEISAIKPDEVHGGLRAYLVDKIKKARPTYSNNDVINIAICIAQGFITVFSGTPGSGKTSICNLFGQVLGLDIPVGDYPYTRYVPLSVGRGWTSQRDFIGYYNPLSKEFDKSNQQVFDAFCIADQEKENSKYPMFILLDEANLSPMEHYWSEFIRICDDREKYNTINCGGINTFSIPKTMRFLATINNDDTTTSLSPRMIDRSWVITLPKLMPKDLLVKGRDFEEGELIRITWDDFYDTFGPKTLAPKMEEEVQKLLSDILEIMPDLAINARMYHSILDYYSAAKECFDPKDNSYVPLDYAVAQRVLPKINGVDGQGDTYGKQLSKLKEYLEAKEYNKSAEIVNEIIERGKDIGYYQFF